MDFPVSCAADAEGWLTFRAADAAQLERYLGHHGLVFTPYVSALAISELWSELRRRFGQAIRLTALGRAAEVPSLCAHLSPPEQEYAYAVGGQDLQAARRIAKTLFTRSEQRTFIR